MNSLKTKQPLLIISISIALLLACQLIAQTPVNNSDIPIQTQNPTLIPTLTEAPTPTEVQTEPTSIPIIEITDDHGVPMMLVPEGDFMMGNGVQSDESPVHQAHLDTFYIDKYEVTNAFYKICVDEGKCDEPNRLYSDSRSNYFGNSEYDNYPVLAVDWFQAKTYCEWRGANLPTEAQWEKAARGTDSRIYPWGDVRAMAKDSTNYDNNQGDTTAVGSYQGDKSPYGLYDMSGNVSEWVADWYADDYYQNSPATNPTGPDDGLDKVVRGGAWNSLVWDIDLSNRQINVANYYLVVGFRCARDANP